MLPTNLSLKKLFEVGTICLLALATGVTLMAKTASSAEQSLKLSVAIPESNGERSIVLDEGWHFHVILANASNKGVRIWKDSNSWGYAALSFELTDGSGKRSRLQKKEQDWRKNTPSFWDLASGESLVYDVYLSNGEWDGLAADMTGHTASMRAVLTIEEDEKSGEFGVWTGRVESSDLTYVFR
jgi:hypothetical protein